MKEETDRLRGAQPAQLLAQREEMIVVNPKHGIGIKPQKAAGHSAIYCTVRIVILLGGADQIGAGLEDGRGALPADDVDPAVRRDWRGVDVRHGRQAFAEA